MKKYISFLLFILFLLFGTSAQAGVGKYYLIPPQNCVAQPVECMAYLQWNAPDSLGSFPPGLLGYNVYRNGVMIHYVAGQDTLSYYDFNLPPGLWQYSVTARYDLTLYGFPGQIGESGSCQANTIYAGCAMILPFSEPWDQGTFVYQDWDFLPTVGNWNIDTQNGNPLPAAFFSGQPQATSYSHSMKSIYLDGMAWTCADIIYEFDYRLEDVSNSGTEHLEAGYFIGEAWNSLITLSNDGTTGWQHIMLDLDTVGGNIFNIYFRVYGENSLEITGWWIDNILVKAKCRPVFNESYLLDGNVVELSWDHPCDTTTKNGSVLIGYNVYRTGASGLPPYIKLNEDPVAGKQYYDTIDSISTGNQFRYTITAMFNELEGSSFLCESEPGDTLMVIPWSGIGIHDSRKVKILPNPTSGWIMIESPAKILSAELINLCGATMKRIEVISGKNPVLDLSDLEDGIYFLRIKSDKGESTHKVVKL